MGIIRIIFISTGVIDNTFMGGVTSDIDVGSNNFLEATITNQNKNEIIRQRPIIYEMS
jgi:hypothetical protein